MQKTFLTIIIKDNISISAIDALQRQSFTNWECVIANNSVENLEKYIANDSRFSVLNGTDKIKNINSAIQNANGEYVIIINSDDIFTANAFSDIFYMADLTDSEIIRYNVDKNLPEFFDEEHKCIFQYIIRRNLIMESVFADLSAFCFRKDFITKYRYDICEPVIIFNMLKETPAITQTNQIYVLQSENHNIYQASDYVNIIDNFQNLKNDFDNAFWKKYFGVLIPNLTRTMMTNQTRADFIHCCKNIPLKYIPSRYKFMYFILRNTNK